MIKPVKSIIFQLATMFLLFLILTALTPAPATELYVIYTNNTNGALENCLCPGKSYGSLEKRVRYIREWLADHPNSVIVDAGDFLSATKNTLKDSIAFRGMELIPYDAIGLGDQEFFRGVEFFDDLSKDSKLPFVSTNMVKPDLASIRDEIIVEKNGVKFGFISVMDPVVFVFYPKSVQESVSVTPYEDILRSKLISIREKVDVVIVLSHLGIDSDRELARKFNGIDIIVGSHTQSVMEQPEKIGNTLIVQAGKDGYYVGELKLELDKSGQIQTFTGKLIPMDISLPNDSMMIAMIIEYNRISRSRLSNRVERISTIPRDYMVSIPVKCGLCHKSQLDHWKTTSHAVSFETLEVKHKHKSPDCLACHTTGFGRDDGYLNYNITAELKNVNCTECHYLSIQHIFKPELNPPDLISEDKCIRCHDTLNNPEFQFDKYVSQIRHPVKEEVPVAPPTIVSAAYFIHRVAIGETLWHLADKFLGDGSEWVEIYNLNEEILDNPNRIYEGQSLKIPQN